MTYVITAPCIADYSCVEVCPVDCIGPRPDDKAFDTAEQLYIDPATCIDCAACVDVCPVLAIHADHKVPAQWQHYIEINSSYFAKGRQRAGA
jgi:ferredoxin